MSREQEIAQLKTTLSLDTGDFKKQLTSVSKETTGLKKSFDIASKSIENAEDKVEATTKAIGKGERALESMNSKLALQKKRYDELKSTVEKQSKAYNKLSQDLNKSEKELEQLEQAEIKNVEAIDKQKKAIDELKKKLQDKSQLLEKNITNMQRYSNDIDKTENDINGLSSQLGKLRNSLNDTAKATEEVNKATEDSKLGDFKDLASKTGVDLGFLELSAKGAALALAVVITKSVIDGAASYDKSITDLQITMGITEDSAKDLYSAIKDISKGGYSIEGVGQAVQMLEQRFKLSAEETENLAQGMDILNKYGYESKDIMRFMTTAVNDWGMNYEEALDYILKGQQNGLNMSDDWMDTLNEYSPIFSTLGIDGKTAMGLISEAMNATGVDSDKAADMIKEMMLTLTDGSDSSVEAIEGIGLSYEDMSTLINDGKVSEVFDTISQAIMNTGSETEKAKALQDIFKGTVEYGSVGIIESWANVGTEVIDTTGAIDDAKKAFEGSYEAAKQDLSNSWNDLTQTIGSSVVPILIWVVDLFNNIAITVLNIGPLVKNEFLKMGNDIAQWSLGAVGKFQEFQIACIEGAIKIAEALGKDEWASKWKESLEGVKQKHSETVGKIIENENKRTEIESQDQALRDEIYGRDKNNHTDTANAIVKNNDNVKKSSGETNKKLETDSANSANKVSQNAQKMGTDMNTNMNKAKTSAETSMKGVKSAVDNNMDGSLRTIQVQATDMYKGVKTSFHKMSQAAREDGTEMYLGVQTSANKMASSAKNAATDMYKGVTTSTSRMAEKAISDWNRVRDAYAKPINANISVKKTETTVKSTIKAPTQGYNLDTNIVERFNDLKTRIPNISRVDFRNDVVSSNYSKMNSNENSNILTQISNQNNLIEKLINSINQLNSKPIEVYSLLDGNIIANATAPYSDKVNGKRINLSERGVLL